MRIDEAITFLGTYDSTRCIRTREGGGTRRQDARNGQSYLTTILRSSAVGKKDRIRFYLQASMPPQQNSRKEKHYERPGMRTRGMAASLLSAMIPRRQTTCMTTSAISSPILAPTRPSLWDPTRWPAKWGPSPALGTADEKAQVALPGLRQAFNQSSCTIR